MIVGIDPGPEKQALVEWDGERVVRTEEVTLGTLADWMNVFHSDCNYFVEAFVPYGQRLGHESIATIEAIGVLVYLGATKISRPDVKMHLCGVRTARDADVRDALIARFGPGREQAVGRKKKPGPLFGVTGHCWAALAVAVTAWDREQGR